MVPIHDSDLAEERWSKVEWENYELWEKIEQRLRWKKQLWIFATVILFLILSSIPIIMDRWPKWMTRSISRHLAQELNWVKREASIHRAAYRFRFVESGKLDFVIERLASCSLTKGEIVKTGSLEKPNRVGDFTWLTSDQGDQLGVPGLISSFCYDSLSGSGEVQVSSLAGFGLVPVRDLTEKRMDRMSVLLINGPSAEITFD